MTYQGETYVGDWFKNKRTGKGKMTFSDDDVYEGEFSENIMNGKGTMFFSNGDVYRGSFSDGVRHGKGELVLANGETIAEEWRHGVLVGGEESEADSNLRQFLAPYVEMCLDIWRDVSRSVVDIYRNFIR
jgi:hypothetical protein